MEVRLYATLRAATDGGRVDVPGSCRTVREALGHLVERFPGLSPLILIGPDELRPMIAVMVDGRDIRHLAGLDTPLEPASTVDIFPPVAGGAEVTRAITIRGLPGWLVRDYLEALGGRAEDHPECALRGDGWRASWTARIARVPGSTMTLTEFTIAIVGAGEVVERVERAFLAKAQRGGG